VSSESSASEGEDDTQRVKSSLKRRKLETSPPSTSQQRYFVQLPASTKGKERAFSPSVPVQTNDEVDSQADDSSVPGSDIEERDEAAEEVDEGRTRWGAGVSAPSTPRYIERDAGPSRAEVGTSKIRIQEGVNMLRITELALETADDEASGPAVLLSLAETEVGLTGRCDGSR
jgi:hypothetical protein